MYMPDLAMGSSSDLDMILRMAMGEFRPVFQAVGVLLLLYGLANAFFGYKLFKFILMLTGFLTGGIIGTIVSVFLWKDNANDGLLFLGFLIGGILGAVLAVALHRLGVFLFVGTMVCLFFYVLTGILLIALVLGIVCGIIGAILEKYTIIISTGLSGGSIAGVGVGWICQLGQGAAAVVGLLIGIGGIIFQLWMERRKTVVQPVAAPVPQPAGAVPVYTGAAIPTAAPAAPAGVPPQNGSQCCTNCGSALSAGAAFCGKCGYMVQEESSSGAKTFCRKCGAEIPASANFCRKCGTSRSL